MSYSSLAREFRCWGSEFDKVYLPRYGSHPQERSHVPMVPGKKIFQTFTKTMTFSYAMAANIWTRWDSFGWAERFDAAQLEVLSSAFSLGLNPGLCVVACLVGNIIVSVPCAASGYLGSYVGTNFPGTVRASFGMWGATWAMVVRGVHCLIYYGIQVSLAG
jgi:cytosine/uracil/thiamine/allantoin permease